MEKVQAEIIERLQKLLALAEEGRVDAVALIIIRDDRISWEHSSYRRAQDACNMIVMLEACKIDLMAHAVPLDCGREGPRRDGENQ